MKLRIGDSDEVDVILAGTGAEFAVGRQLPHKDEEDTEHLDRKKRIMDAILDYERDNR